MRCAWTQDNGAAFQFRRYLLVSRAYTDDTEAAAEAKDDSAADGVDAAAVSTGTNGKRKKASPRPRAALLRSLLDAQMRRTAVYAEPSAIVARLLRCRA